MIEEDEIHSVKEIAKGLYTVWTVNKPSKVQKFLDALDGKNKSSDNDKKMELGTSSTRILVTTYRSKVTIHKVTMKETGESVSVSKIIDMESTGDKREFSNKFAEYWVSAVSELQSDEKTQVAT